MISSPDGAASPRYTSVQKLSREIKVYSRPSGNLLKIVAAMATALTFWGAGTLAAYLLQVGAPVTPIDSSVGIFIGIVSAGTLAIILFLLLNQFLLTRANSGLKEAYPTFFEPNKKDQLGKYVWHYVRFFLPLLCFLLISYAFELMSWPISYNLVGFIIGGVAEFFLSGRHCSPNRLGLEASVMRANMYAVLCFVFSLTIFWVFVEGYSPHLSDTVEWLLILLFLLLGTALHAFLNASISNMRTVVSGVLIALAVLFIFFPGAAFIGGSTLRMLRIGGGLPTTMFLKSDPSHPVSGCLILSTGTQLIVTLSQSASEGCSAVSPSARWPGARPATRTSRRSTSNAVIAYERSDVLRSSVSLPVNP